jgi:hypothetical protein
MAWAARDGTFPPAGIGSCFVGSGGGGWEGYHESSVFILRTTDVIRVLEAGPRLSKR